MQISLAADVAETFAIAAKAFQGQLEVCSKQLPGNRHSGYRSFPGKHRLEHRPGADCAGVLQGLTTMVSLTRQSLNRCIIWGYAAN